MKSLGLRNPSQLKSMWWNHNAPRKCQKEKEGTEFQSEEKNREDDGGGKDRLSVIMGDRITQYWTSTLHGASYEGRPSLRLINSTMFYWKRHMIVPRRHLDGFSALACHWVKREIIKTTTPMAMTHLHLPTPQVLCWQVSLFIVWDPTPPHHRSYPSLGTCFLTTN